MHLPDINVWLALTFQSHVNHNAALQWLESADDLQIAFCRQTQQGFLRIATNPKAMGEHAVTIKKAWQLYETIEQDSRVCFEEEPSQIQSLWKRFTYRQSKSPKLWNDAWLAAFCLGSGAQLVSFDKAFRQFETLDYILLSPTK